MFFRSILSHLKSFNTFVMEGMKVILPIVSVQYGCVT